MEKIKTDPSFLEQKRNRDSRGNDLKGIGRGRLFKIVSGLSGTRFREG